MGSALAGRVSLDRERVDFPSHHRAEQVVDHPMTSLERLSRKAGRNEPQTIMTAAAFCAFVAGVLRGFILDIERFRCECGKSLTDLFGYCQFDRP
jgi:hypothetical protein